MSKPVVASFCSTFLKAEMQHVYRQVTGLRRYHCAVITQEYRNSELFPFPDLQILPEASIGILERGWRKYVLREPALIYRGQCSTLLRLLAERDQPVDLMHVYFGHAGVHLLPFIERWDRPVVVSFHGMDAMPRPKDKTYDSNMRRLLQKLPLVLARSQSLAHVLMDWGCPGEKIRINGTSVPLDSFSYIPRKFPEDGAWKMIQVCRFIEKKGLDLTLQAFAKFRERFPKAELLLVGEGALEPKLRLMAADLGIANAVAFPGFQKPAELAKLLHGSYIFLHPSRITAGKDQEGIPNTMLEAMATGLPVVATRHGGIPEAVEHGKTGLLCPENEAECLTRALFELADSPELLASMGAAAARSVQEHFSADRQIEKLEGYYDEARERFASISARQP